MLNLKTLPMVMCTAALATLSQAQAQTSTLNQAPVCAPKTLIIGSMAKDTQVTELNIDPLKVPPACTDADGDTLTVTSVGKTATLMPNGEAKIKMALNGKQSLQITFTVSDGKGGKTNATLTIKRE